MPGDVKKETVKTVVNCFGVVCPVVEPIKADDRYLTEYDQVLNKETGQFETVITGKTDLVELIQSFKDQCGIEAMKLAIAKGRDPLFYADDGKHGLDATGVSTDINVAFRKSIEAEEMKKKILADLGISSIPDGVKFEDAIKDAVIKKYGAQAPTEGDVK